MNGMTAVEEARKRTLQDVYGLRRPSVVGSLGIGGWQINPASAFIAVRSGVVIAESTFSVAEPAVSMAEVRFPTQHYPGQPFEPVQPITGFRSRELERRQAHKEVLRAFENEWVVLEGEEIVAHGIDIVRVVAEARSRGIQAPYIFYVEPVGENSVKIGL